MPIAKEIHHNLEIWQRANSLCLKLYTLSNRLPRSERFSLFNKIRNSSELVPLKIAQGAASAKVDDYIHYLKVSYRLLIKLKTEVLISKHLQYISTELLKSLDDELNILIDLILRMINLLELQQQAFNPAFAYSYQPAITN
ncbi:MAG: four helix bundle protein [Candidatus Omnitrophica bacterium]|nr:four helix bundle protein [Candidatus Omnitrophota bacterium]